MSSCPRQVHYSWQLKHYLGPHNHGAVRMTYCLFWAGPQQMHAKSPYGSWCFEFSITQDFRPLLSNPLSQVYICHDSGLTLRELALSSCTKTVSPALHNVHCLPSSLRESLHNAHWCLETARATQLERVQENTWVNTWGGAVARTLKLQVARNTEAAMRAPFDFFASGA